MAPNALSRDGVPGSLSPLITKIGSVPRPGRDQPAAPAVKLQSLKTAVVEMEQRMIAEALRETRNNQQQAARLLGLSRQGLINKMKRYSIAG